MTRLIYDRTTCFCLEILCTMDIHVVASLQSVPTGKPALHMQVSHKANTRID